MATNTVPYGQSDPTMYPVNNLEPEYDLEKSSPKGDDVQAGTTMVTRDASEASSLSDGVTKPKARAGVFGKISEKLSSYGVEETGIERVLPSERSDQSPMSCFTMWMAANTTVSTFALGTLGSSIWQMGFKDAALTILFFNLFPTLVVAYFSTWGPKTGLRQLALSRFGFGYFTVLLPTILNCIACIGWSTINSLAGAFCLQAVSMDSSLPTIPIAAAIVVIAVSTLAVSFMGYRVVHLYEKYSWYPVLIIFIVYAGFIGSSASSGDWGAVGETAAANVLSFGASIVGFAIGWSSLAADYSCKLRETTPSWKVFLATYAGLNGPMVTVELLGAAAMTTFAAKPSWEEHYHTYEVGGLLGAPLIERMGGGGRFFLIILALSIIANNIPNIYSFGLTFQVLGPWAQMIPRPLLSLAATIIYVVLAIVGADSFESALDTLLILLAYWLAIYSSIMLLEHHIFRKGSFENWDFNDIDTPRRLPLGAAAFAALCIGWAGAILGMASVWFVGPLAKQIGNPAFGGDIGFELAAAFTIVSYIPLRWIEKKKWGF